MEVCGRGAVAEMRVSIRGLRKSFDATHVIESLSMEFTEDRISVLLGASGCGKTTLLRCIAGLETPDGGDIHLGERAVFRADPPLDLPPEQRDIGMVFQSYAVWPHLTVFENVAVPLQARRVDRATTAKRVSTALEAVGLGAFADRSATKLSGGQQQRLALARCIVAQSRLILLDEPLSNLDAGLRVQMRSELRALQRSLGMTMILVTHDQEEALSLADEVHLLDHGRLVQSGAPRDLYHRPQSRFCAAFLGNADFIPVRGWKADADGLALECDHQITLRAPIGTAPPTDGKFLAVIRPEAWSVSARHSGDGFPGTVIESSFLGGRTQIRLDSKLGQITALADAELSPGDALWVRAWLGQVHFIADMPT